MPQTKSSVTVTIGNMEFNCSVDWSYCEGEPMVRYYPDGSGYPGSDPSMDCIDHVEIEECEYLTGDIDDDDNWGYTDFADRPGAKEIAARWCRAELEGGSYDDELFANAEGADYDE